jgi:hypothetical protein
MADSPQNINLEGNLEFAIKLVNITDLTLSIKAAFRQDGTQVIKYLYVSSMHGQDYCLRDKTPDFCDKLHIAYERPFSSGGEASELAAHV